jgi:hypothetical protein
MRGPFTFLHFDFIFQQNELLFGHHNFRQIAWPSNFDELKF